MEGRNDIPKNWAISSLQEVAEINPTLDKSALADALEVSFVPMPAVEAENGRIDVSQIRKFGEVKKGYTPFQKGDVLFAKITPCMENGKMAVVPDLHSGVGFGSTEFHVLRAHRGIESQFLYYFVSSKTFRYNAEHNMTGAVGQKRVPTAFLEKCNIPLPPTYEQRRIVAKIEELFSELDKGIESLKTARKQLKVYRKSLLNHIFDSAPESKLLSDLISAKPQNGYSGKPVKYETKNLVLSLSATTSGTLKECYFKYLDEDGLEERDIWCQPGDILIQRGNTIEYVGVSAIYNGLPKKYIFPDLMIRLRANDFLIETKYLYYALSSEKLRNYLRSKAIGSAGTMPKINQSTLLSTEIPLFPKTQQSQIIAEIEFRFSLSDILMQSIDDAESQSEALRQSILKKAFSGKLVAQDPDDEPASALLEHIKAEKAAVSVPKKQARMKRKEVA